MWWRKCCQLVRTRALSRISFFLDILQGIKGMQGDAGETGAIGPMVIAFWRLARDNNKTLTYTIHFTRISLFVHPNSCLFQGDNGYTGTKGPPGVPGEYVSKSDKLKWQEQQTKACHHRHCYHLIPLAGNRVPKTLHGRAISVGYCIAPGSSFGKGLMSSCSCSYVRNDPQRLFLVWATTVEDC